MEIIQENKKNIGKIITALKNGAVLVLPTDTVYGLVCDAANNKAVKKIFAIKKRDKSKPLPVFVKDITTAKKYAIVSGEQEDFLNKSWPGATTAVLKGRKGLSPLVYKNSTIALRQPDYKLIMEVMEALDKPLAQTSANISGEGVLNKISEITSQFKNEDVIIINAGDLPKRKPSTIIDITDNKIKILRK